MAIENRPIQAPPPPPPPPVPPPDPQEKVHVVRPNDTLEGVAREHTTPDTPVTAQEIADRNAIDTNTAINPGENLIVPTIKQHPAPTTPPATPEAQRVDAALQETLRAEDNLAAFDASPVMNSHQRASFQQQGDDKRVALQDAIAVQIQADHAAANSYGGSLNPALIAQQGVAIAQRHAADPAAQAAITDAVQQVGIQHEVDTALATASALPDAKAITDYLGKELPKLSQPAQAQLLTGPQYTSLIDQRVAPSLTDPLQGTPWKESPGAQAQIDHSLETLQSLVAGTDPRVANNLTDRHLIALEGLQTRIQADGSLMDIGPPGTRALQQVAGQVGGTPEGDALVQRMGGLPLDGLTLSQGVAEGAAPDLILAAAANGGGERMYQQALGSVRQFQSTVQDNANAYAEHIEELNYLTANGRTAGTPDQLAKAIDEYIHARPEWKAQFDTLQNQLASDGAHLLDQAMTLNAAIPGMPADQQAAFRGDAAAILQDQHAQLAVTTALRQQPELARGQQGQHLIDSFAALGIVGADNVLATTATAAYLRENVLAPSVNLNLTNAGSLAQARSDLETALRGNTGLAQVMDIKPEQLDAVVDSLLDLVPATPQSVNDASAANNSLRNLNNTLDKLDGALWRDADMPFRTQFRTSALGIVSAGLMNSWGNLLENPNLRNGLQVAVDSARVGVDGAQFVTALTNNVPESRLVTGLQASGKVVHMLGASLAGIDAVGRLAQGDVPGALLNAAVAGGVSYAVFGSAALAGPIGFGIATVSTLGLWGYDSFNAAQHNSRFESQAAQDFLAGLGFDPDAAAALRNQSGESYSPVTLLAEYAERKGYKLTEDDTHQRAFTTWVNGMTPEQLGKVRDLVHRTLDEFDGDVGRLGNDPTVVTSLRTVVVMDNPRTVGEIDAMLGEFGVRQLPNV